ncbi:MAG: hypothetical protein SXG53_17405, partial [Pseudomonadota bacterium]|nr:hypothetical protein [Pseudomonadota bacterium]
MTRASRNARARTLGLHHAAGLLRAGPLLALLLAGCASSPPQPGGTAAPAAGGRNDVDQIAATALALWGTNANANGS